ncbi:MAG: hypothetical protein ACLGI2_14505 [Acidimicrobiia bacterium]
MDHEGTVIVFAYVDIASADKKEWVAKTALPEGAPLAGLFAFGNGFATARKALAEVVWKAVAGGAAGIDPKGVTAVRVFATTRKTFPVSELASAA